MIKKYLEIVDPIHDFIRIYEAEIKVIDTAVFQRLRRIRQLAGAHLVYPGAQHSRFEHSLGVMHISGQAAEVLKDKGFLNSDDVANLRLGGLLHDVGHGPFSHLFEEVLEKKKKISTTSNSLPSCCKPMGKIKRDRGRSFQRLCTDNE